MKTTRDIVLGLLALQSAYANVRRHIVTTEQYNFFYKDEKMPVTDLNDERIRESLLDHVGHLPVVATYLHPHIENSSDVDLAHTLLLLALHDIGETKVGDIFSHKKTEKHTQDETKAALELLPESLHSVYLEYEERNTLEGMFAKSIDAIAPLTRSTYIADVVLQHAAQHGMTMDVALKDKRRHFMWDKFLLDAFDLLIEHYRKVEAGEEPIFT